MIIGPELRLWLLDRRAQRLSREASQAFAGDWNRGPVHRALEAVLDPIRGAGAEAVAACVRELFSDCRWTSDLVEALTVAVSRDPYFDVPFRHLNGGIGRGLVLYEDDLVSIAMATIDIGQLAARKGGAGARGSIHFSGQLEIVKFLSGAGARLRFWTTRPIGADFSASNAGHCEPREERQIAPGDILIVDGRRETFIIEHARSSLVMLQATVKADRAPVSVEYDHDTREYLGCSAADDSASRIQMITTLLRQLGSRKAAATMAEFLDHGSFFVRWHVMREMIGLDPETALPHLKRMAARDPHPETRRAARTVLDRIQAPPPRRRAA